MTIKELKEKIENDSLLIMPYTEQLNQLNEDLDVEVILQSDILDYSFQRGLQIVYLKYKETLKNKVEKTIARLREKLPNFVFEYVIMNHNARIKYKYILNNTLKEKSFVLNKEDLDNLDYDYIVKQILDDIQK